VVGRMIVFGGEREEEVDDSEVLKITGPVTETAVVMVAVSMSVAVAVVLVTSVTVLNGKERVEVAGCGVVTVLVKVSVDVELRLLKARAVFVTVSVTTTVRLVEAETTSGMTVAVTTGEVVVEVGSLDTAGRVSEVTFVIVTVEVLTLELVKGEMGTFGGGSERDKLAGTVTVRTTCEV
jgi:hypothetical protein